MITVRAVATGEEREGAMVSQRRTQADIVTDVFLHGAIWRRAEQSLKHQGLPKMVVYNVCNLML